MRLGLSVQLKPAIRNHQGAVRRGDIDVPGFDFQPLAYALDRHVRMLTYDFREICLSASVPDHYYRQAEISRQLFNNPQTRRQPTRRGPEADDGELSLFELCRHQPLIRRVRYP